MFDRFFTSLTTLQDINGWSKETIAQYYQMILSLCPLPWQVFVTEPFYCAQFMHKLEPAEPPKSAGPSQLYQLFKSAPSAKARPKAQASKSEGYYKSQYAVIDPEHTITQLIKLVQGAEDLSEIGSLENIHNEITKKLEALKYGMDAQEFTLFKILEDAKKMQDEQLLLAQMQLELTQAKEKISTALTEMEEKKSFQNMKQSQSKAPVFKAPPSSLAYVFAPMPSQAAQGPEAANDHQMPPPKPSKKTAPWQVAQAAQGSDATQKSQEPPPKPSFKTAPWQVAQAAQGSDATQKRQEPPPKPYFKTAPWQVAQAAQGSDATQKRQEPEAANDHQNAPWQLPQRSNATTEGTTEPDLETY